MSAVCRPNQPLAELSAPIPHHSHDAAIRTITARAAMSAVYRPNEPLAELSALVLPTGTSAAKSSRAGAISRLTP
ncbi:MAG TPA: hypothetical protein VF824_17725 [Thermoanaerobaculia bacterium]|jgi:hypothetical protein